MFTPGNVRFWPHRNLLELLSRDSFILATAQMFEIGVKAEMRTKVPANCDDKRSICGFLKFPLSPGWAAGSVQTCIMRSVEHFSLHPENHRGYPKVWNLKPLCLLTVIYCLPPAINWLFLLQECAVLRLWELSLRHGKSHHILIV